jgi:hypothetical protein
MRCWPSSTSELIGRDLIEIDQPERIALEQRMDDRLFPLPTAIGIEVVTLILRLNGELATQPEQPLPSSWL